MGISNLNIPAAPPEEELSDDDADEDFPNRFTRNPLPNLSSSVLSAMSMSPRAQAGRTPTRGATPNGAGTSGSQGTGDQAPGTAGTGIAGLALGQHVSVPDLCALLSAQAQAQATANQEATNNTFAAILQQVTGYQMNNKKRKVGDEDLEETEDTSVNVTLTVQDNFCSTVDVRARSLLGRNPSGKPGEYWGPGEGKRWPKTVSPVMATQIDLSHIMPVYIATETVLARHDTTRYVELKHFTNKNSGLSGKITKTWKLGGSEGEDSLGLKHSREWVEVVGVHEAMEGVLNMVVLEHHLRNYNYGPLVILRVCHSAKWFSGVCGAGAGKTQKDIIVLVVNQLLRKNTTQAIQNHPPMTFEEAWKETERVVRCELNVDPNRLIYGDGYAAQGSGAGTGNHGAGPSGSGGGSGGGSGNRNKKKSGNGSAFSQGERDLASWNEKDRDTCRDYNKGTCHRETCKYKHACNVRTGAGQICWSRTHIATECPHRNGNREAAPGRGAGH